MPLSLMSGSLVLFVFCSWLWLNEPGNTSHYIDFLLDAPKFVYTLINIGMIIGPLLFLTGILMLILRIRKNDENIYRR